MNKSRHNAQLPSSPPHLSLEPVALVVDDEPETVNMTRRFLASVGIDSIGCHDGVEALKLLRNLKFDAIISDVSIPTWCGIVNDMGLLDPRSAVYRCAKHIVLEITEKATLDKVVDIRGRLQRLIEVGYRIAIDDLGAGYAGLTCFASLKPEFVKFDMALVRDIDKSDVKQRLMRVMSGLCHDMGMQVVAEGIETVEERDTVIEPGCDLLQGHLFGRPSRDLKVPLG